MQQPYFLNNGGNRKAKDGIMLWYAGKNPYIAGLKCTGAITIHSTYNGIATTETYSDLNNAAIAIKADPNTEVYIEGIISRMINASSEKRIRCHNTALTELDCNSCTGLTDLNLSANTALTKLDCSSCTGLTDLNLSANTALTELYCSSCYYLTTIYAIAKNKNVSDIIVYAIQSAFASNGTLYINSSDTYASTVISAATDKGWSVENLPAA